MLEMQNILLSFYPNTHIKDAPFLPFSRIWKVINYFVQLKESSPLYARILSSTSIFFVDCEGYDADSSFSCSVCCHCWHQSRWIQVQFYFSFRIWYFWLDFKFLCTIFTRINPCTWYSFLNNYDLLYFLGVPCML